MDLVGLIALVIVVGAFGMLAGSGGRSATELRMRRRWDASIESEIRRQSRTDATGVLLCRSCGSSASERAGRCPRCGAVL